MKKAKRILSLLITVIMVFSMFATLPMNVSAAETEVANVSATTGTTAEGLEYEISDGEVTITEYTGSATSLVIPSEIEDCPVTSIGIFAFEDCESIVSVVIPEGVTAIYDYAFSGCISLENIVIPEGVTIIDYDAFNYCTSLSSITLPSTLETISPYAFRCCFALESITIPEGVTLIDGYVFDSCTSLKEVNLPDSIETIDNNAFYGCTALEAISIPAGVATFNGSVFNLCSSLVNINVSENNENYCDVDGIAFSKDKTTIVYYPTGRTEDSYTVPDGVTNIGDGAFQCSVLSNITLPQGVITIGERAFDSCSNLEYIELPEGVESIGYSSFMECTALTSVSMPSSVKSIDQWAFAECSNLTEVTIPSGITEIPFCSFVRTGITSISIPEGVQTIHEHAFEECASLSSVDIPSSVTEIRGYAFNECTSLTDVYYGGTQAQWDEIAIGRDNECLTNATIHFAEFIPEGLKYEIADGEVTITGYAGSATELVIPSTIEGYPVTSLGDSAFSDCYEIEHIILPEGITSIGRCTFMYCESLESIAIPGSVINIGEYAFDWCLSLESITVEASNAVYDSRNDCNAIIESTTNTLIKGCKNTIIPSSVTNIGEAAFFSCLGLETIIIPEGVTSIEDFAFAENFDLKSITISESVTNIGDSAFEFCDSLAEVYYKGTQSQWKEIVIGDYNECLTNASVVYKEEAYPKIYFDDSLGWGNIYVYCFGGDGELFGAWPGVPCDYVEGNIWSITMTGVPEAVIFHGYSGPQTSDIPYAGGNMIAKLTGEWVSGSYSSGVAVAEFEEYNGNSSSDPEPEPIPEELYYNVSNGKVTITYYSGEATELTIPSTIEGYPVTKIQSWVFMDNTKLESVVLPERLEIIEDFAFEGCTSLTEIFIPQNVTTIESRAFENCSGLISIKVDVNNKVYDSRDNCNAVVKTSANALIVGSNNTVIPSSVTSIGDYAFSGRAVLKNVAIPNRVTSIGWSAFSGCSGITAITIPAAVTDIGRYAFGSCTALESIIVNENNSVFDSRNNCNAIIETETDSLVIGCKNTVIPDSVKTIKWFAFYYCKSLESIDIPYGISDIGSEAFIGCTSLTSIEFSDSVTAIGSDAFNGCTSLEDITVPDSVTRIGLRAFNNTAYYNDENNWINDVLYIDNALIKAKNVVSGAYRVKSGTTVIADYAFYECSNLTNINLPDEVKSIGGDAFKGCINLESVLIPPNVTTINQTAFSGCKKLTNITIPKNVTALKFGSFVNCTGIESVTIPAKVTSIGQNAFYNCSSLTDVYYDGSLSQWNAIAIESGNESLTNATIHFAEFIPEGLKYEITDGEVTITDYTGSATELVIPSTIEGYPVTCIGDYAFRECNTLVSITIPEGVTSIGDYAFSNCKSLTSITIPESVTSIGVYAFYHCESLESITIPEGVTRIGSSLFAYCTSLSSITLPESVTNIGWNAFYNCESITSITIPQGVTSIGKYAFYDCESLTSITIPQRVTSIDGNVFGGCYSLTSIIVDDDNTVYDSRNNCNAIIETATNTLISGCKTTVIPEGVTIIGDSAFLYCTSLESITIPENVTSIGDSAFYYCTSLSSITIPDSVTSIDTSAFAYCTSLSSITIPEGVTCIDGNVFVGCDNITSIIVDEDNTVYDSRNNCNAIIETATNTLISGCKTTVIPEGVTIIGDSAFNRCKSPESITIPEGVTSIGDSAFECCSTLTSITIPESVTSIDDDAFYYCIALTDVYYNGTQAQWETITIGSNNTPLTSATIHFTEPVPEGLVYEIADGEVTITDYTGSATELIIPSTIEWCPVTTIGDYAFYYCASLSSIIIPSSVTNIDSSAFRSCTSLMSISIPEGVTSISNYAFAYCASLTSITIPESVTSIGDRAFGDCPSLTSITIPEGVTSIGDYAFYYCESLANITIPESVTSIGEGAFRGCKSITNITIPLSVTSIDDFVLSYCASLTSITIPESVTSIGDWAFCDCPSLTSITIPEGVKSIAGNALVGCDRLTSIIVDEDNTVYDSRDNCNAIIETATNTLISGCNTTVIPEGVTSIGDDAFNRYTSLVSITIPQSVTSIGDSAFRSCTSLTSITIPQGVTNIGDYAFYNCTSLSSITIPQGVTSIGDWAFNYCDALTDVYYGGTQAQWDEIAIGRNNECLTNATIHFAEPEIETYTVTFVDWDGTVLSTQQVQAGSSALEPMVPTREGNAQYTYTFKEWSNDFSAVMSDMTITAVYTETLRKYTVTYYNYNGAYFYSEQVEYGKAALGPMSTPTRPTSNGRTYTFNHWDKQDELGYVTGNISTQAVFTSSVITYTVTFVSYDGSVLKTQQVRHGGSATAPAKPPVPAGYTSTWNPADFSYITSNLTVRLELIDNNVYIIGDMNDWTAAIMSQTSTNGNIYSKKYTLEAGLYEFKFQYPKDTWYGNNGTVYDSTGGWWSTSQADGNITLQATGGTYEFQFNKQTKQMQVIFNAPEYTVTFVDWNGTELNTQKVKQGNKAIAPANPHRADDETYSYTFTGWDPSVDNPIMGNTTFVAQYSSSLLTYTVNFVDWDGTLISSQAVEYGGAATAPDNPTREHYTFIGWDSDAYVNVTGNLTINAEYVVNTYTVTFVDWNGTVLSTQQVPAGSSALEPIAPTREDTAQYTYTFAGWDQDFSSVTEDMVVTAIYTQNVRMYTVVYHIDDRFVNSEQVEYGGAAIGFVPHNYESDGKYYTFIGWDKDLSCITNDVFTNAIFEATPITYTVTFKDQSSFGGETLATVTVDHGNAATAPEVEPEDGWEFFAWDMDFSKVTSDITVTALRSNMNVQLMGLDGWSTGTSMRMTYNSDGTNTKTIELEKGTYQLKIYTENWDTWLGNDNAVDDSCTDRPMTQDAGNLVLNASGGMYTFTYTRDTGMLSIAHTPSASVSGDYEYTVSNGEVTITKYTGSATNLVVPEYISDYPVTKIGNDAFAYCKTLTSVELPSTLKEISEKSFMYCNQLLGIKIPEGVTTIGKSAFYGCTVLPGVTIPSTVTRLGDESFIYCKALINVDIREGVQAIGSYAFRGCVELTTVSIPKSVTSVEERAFYGCSKLADVYYGGTDTQWGNIAIAAYNEPLTKATLHCDSQNVPLGLTYEIKDEVVTITGYTGSDAFLEIPSTIEGYPVKAIGSYAFDKLTGLVHIEIPESVTSIGEGAFNYCKGITSIELPEGLTEIADNTFYGCTSLVEIVIPDGVKTLGYQALIYCNALEKVTLPESLTDIGDYAFRGCVKLRDIVIPEGVKNMGANTFRGCNLLRTITLPKSLESIGTEAFYNCSSLTDVYYGGSETRWADIDIATGNDKLLSATIYFAISDEDGVFTVTFVDFDGTVLSAQAVEQGSSAVAPEAPVREGYEFSGWDTDFTNVQSNLIVTAKYTPLASVSGDYEYTVSNGEVTITKYTGSATNLVVPEYISDYPVTKIGNDAFAYCKTLTSVELPSTLKEIGTNGFKYCNQLLGIKIPEGVTTIGKSAFYGCTVLPGVTIPSTVTRLGDEAFIYCNALINVDIREGVQAIGSYAFRGCVELTTVSIPKSVTSVEERAFYGCSKLADVYYGGTDTQWGNIAIAAYNEPLTKATLHCDSQNVPLGLTYEIKDEVVTITGYTGSDAFLEIPSTIEGYPVKAIGSYAFDKLTGLVHIEIPESVTSIGEGAFNYCKGITSIELPEGITEIADNTFYGCTSLVEIVIPDGVKTLGYQALIYCNALEKVTLPESLTDIGDYAFRGCVKLRDIVIPEGVKNMGANTFRGCNLLRTITLPKSLESIGAEAFYNCSVLTDVYYAGSEARWSDVNIAAGNDKLLSATIHFAISADEDVFTVTFVDFDGTALSTQTIEYGKSATAPESPSRDGYTFTGWDVDFSRITEDTTVTAQYTRIIPKGTLRIEVTGGTGFTISVNGGNARPQGSVYRNSKIEIGATVTVVARETANANFVGWMNPATGMILSSDYSYTFTASGNDTINAVFSTIIEGVQVVTFKNDKANRILDSQYYAAEDTIQFPDAPTQVGFDFAGWSMTEEEIKSAVANGQDVEVVANWTRAIVPVKVTVNGGTGSGTYNANSAVTAVANAAPAGQKFAYWTDSKGNIKSYSAEYKFFPSVDTEVTAVFVAEDAVIDYQILVDVDSIDTVTVEGKNVFYFSWYCPEEYTFVKSGILAVNKDNYNESTFVAGTSDSNVYDRSPSGTNKAVNSTSWTKSNVTSGQTWRAMAYVQYRDADGAIITVYSNMVEATKD